MRTASPDTIPPDLRATIEQTVALLAESRSQLESISLAVHVTDMPYLALAMLHFAERLTAPTRVKSSMKIEGRVATLRLSRPGVSPVPG